MKETNFIEGGAHNTFSENINFEGKNDEGITATGVNKKVVFDVNQKKVLGVSPVTGDKLTIALREVDYCDSDGNEYKILVLCSEPYSKD